MKTSTTKLWKICKNHGFGYCCNYVTKIRRSLTDQLEMIQLAITGCEQIAQPSQRDRAAGWVSYGHKWKTVTGIYFGHNWSYFTDIIGLSSTTVT